MQSKPVTPAGPLDRYLNYLKEAIDLTIAQPFPLLVGGILAALVSLVTLFVLALPVTAGLETMYLKARRKEPIKPEDVFMYNSKWLPMFKAFSLIWFITVSLPLLATFMGLVTHSMLGALILMVFAMLFPFFAAAWYMHVPALVAHKNMAPTTAMSVSKATVQARGGWINQLLPLAMLGVLNALGTAVAGFGALITTPLSVGVMAFAYEDECGDKGAAQAQPDMAGSTGS